MKSGLALCVRPTHLNSAKPDYVWKRPMAKILLHSANTSNVMPTVPPGQVTACPKPPPLPWFSTPSHVPHAHIRCVAFALRRSAVLASHNSTIIACLCSTPCRPPLLLALPHHVVAVDEHRPLLLERAQPHLEPSGCIHREGVTDTNRLRQRTAPTITTPTSACALTSFPNRESSTPTTERHPSSSFLAD
jgi:hypothetical protein